MPQNIQRILFSALHTQIHPSVPTKIFLCHTYPMNRITLSRKRGMVDPATLVASLFFGFVTLMSFFAAPLSLTPVASMTLEPTHATITTEETFVVTVVVKSTMPVNAFGGELHFDRSILKVESIDYNTSIADLWAEKPWYENGEGTINFAGGTTKKGGFSGEDTLMRITFKAQAEGAGALAIHHAQILEHNGLGTDASLSLPIDALFTVEHQASSTNRITEDAFGSSVKVVKERPTTDLNGDGKQTVADISIFLLNLSSDNPRFDFNLDGDVSTKDLSIIMDAD